MAKNENLGQAKGVQKKAQKKGGGENIYERARCKVGALRCWGKPEEEKGKTKRGYSWGPAVPRRERGVR